MKATRTIVLGLDGAHFELIRPWLQSGDLPNIQQIINEGIDSDMEVCLPPVTSPNWKCYSSGQNPAKFGIFWWENIDKRKRKVYFPSERKNKPTEIWDHLSDAGQSVLVIGTPLTYPPKEVNGAMISGGLDAGSTQYTYPPALEKRLAEEYNYRVHPESDIKTEPEATAEEIHDLISLRFEVAMDMIEEHDYHFIQITSFYLNVLQHFLWDDKATKEGWMIIDEYLGKLLERYQDSNVLIISDHGSNKIDTVVNINRWLHENGYLIYTWRYSLAQTLGEIGISKESLDSLLQRLHLKDLVMSIMPRSFVDVIPNDAGELKQESKTDIIDWGRSTAIASGQGPIYLLDPTVKEELKGNLESFETPDGVKPFRKIYYRDEVYEGEYLDEAPDLILDQNAHVHIRGDIGADVVVDEPNTGVWRAENKQTGMFIGYGPDIDEPLSKQPTILDVAPTLLDLHGLDIPSEMDGDPLFDRRE